MDSSDRNIEIDKKIKSKQLMLISKTIQKNLKK